MDVAETFLIQTYYCCLYYLKDFAMIPTVISKIKMAREIFPWPKILIPRRS